MNHAEQTAKPIFNVILQPEEVEAAFLEFLEQRQDLNPELLGKIKQSKSEMINFVVPVTLQFTPDARRKEIVQLNRAKARAQLREEEESVEAMEADTEFLNSLNISA